MNKIATRSGVVTETKESLKRNVQPGRKNSTGKIMALAKYNVITQIATCTAWCLNTLLDENASVIKNNENLKCT